LPSPPNGGGPEPLEPSPELGGILSGLVISFPVSEPKSPGPLTELDAESSALVNSFPLLGPKSPEAARLVDSGSVTPPPFSEVLFPFGSFISDESASSGRFVNRESSGPISLSGPGPGSFEESDGGGISTSLPSASGGAGGSIVPSSALGSD